MYTLKIKWMRYENETLADESALFIAADQVEAHALVESMDNMSAWEPGSYFDYHITSDDESTVSWPMRLVKTTKDGKDTWYLASMAWILGPDGKTIERLV